MSEIDSNPFADPEAAVNPFGDPSVKQATGYTNKDLDDYNPFGESNQTRTGGGGVAPPRRSDEPAVLPATAPPSYTPSGQQKIDTTTLEHRQEELERKAAELKSREDELKRVQQQTGVDRKNNFPPMPGFCPCGPCFFQDISIDIPVDYQRIVRFTFYLWMGHSLVLFLNIIGAIAFIAVNGSNAGIMLGLSFVWFITQIPMAYCCWFRPLYKAFRSDSSFNFFIFFFIFFFQTCVCVVQAIGIPGYTVGLLAGINLAKTYPAVCIVCVVIGILFGLLALGDAIILIMVHRIYRGTGASFQKAQQEFASGAVRNPMVQQAAKDAAGAAITSQYGSGGNKY